MDYAAVAALAAANAKDDHEDNKKDDGAEEDEEEDEEALKPLEELFVVDDEADLDPDPARDHVARAHSPPLAHVDAPVPAATSPAVAPPSTSTAATPPAASLPAATPAAVALTDPPLAHVDAPGPSATPVATAVSRAPASPSSPTKCVVFTFFISAVELIQRVSALLRRSSIHTHRRLRFYASTVSSAMSSTAK
jgi:hypothetical protein